MKPACIIDLDGTLYDCRERRDKFLLGPKKNFDKFHEAAENDQPNLAVAQLVKAMKFAGFEIVFVSGREERWRPGTERWMKKNLNWKPEDYALFMRKDKDYRKDSEIKGEIFNLHIKDNYEILFCVDDRKQVTQYWRSIGLVCFQVDEGDF
jgi:hypothetical protein